MLIIEHAALENGAHRNQTGTFREIPEGWLPVMPTIEAEAVGYLPFIVIDEVERGWITKVSQGTVPEPEPEPEPAPGPTGPTVEQRVSELEEALDMILTGYTGEEAADETGA